jgi:hypothetical protein
LKSTNQVASPAEKPKGFASEVDECISALMSRWTFPKSIDKDGEATSASFSIGLQLVPE